MKANRDTMPWFRVFYVDGTHEDFRSGLRESSGKNMTDHMFSLYAPDNVRAVISLTWDKQKVIRTMRKPTKVDKP